MHSNPRLRATTEAGDLVDDPSEDGLFLLFEDLEAGQGHFLIVETLADSTGQTYAQAARNDDGTYVVEYRDGSPERHYGTSAPDYRAAHQLVTGWAFDVAGWRDLAVWHQESVGRGKKKRWWQRA